MFSLGSSHKFYLYDSPCDMRKSFDGLCGLVGSVMKRGATSGEVFVFLNRNRTHIKLLHWENGGFVLYYKRLEQGTFPTPKDPKIELSWSELVLMIEGIQVIKSIQKKRYSLL
ncbi:IS66 family insertion sequence element accessory protein TnpB [Sphingobacterium sp. JB170]|uniref:IS66 family insertion sequence element accessory protein TnpB n=1 Tax=Sphingobacterium sp. JB170 TaxID=1434842 RepID=UPI000B360375|nr:IS66 family insertion sequence element accessory protein TnpB [Sphingobacterium sp. JB170]